MCAKENRNKPKSYKNTKKWHSYLQVSFFVCNFAAQNESFAVLSPRWGYMSFGWVTYRTYWKRRLTRFVLASWNLVNSLFQNIATLRCPWCVYTSCAHIAYLINDIHTAWASVLLFGTKGNTRASRSGTARLQSRFCFYKRNTGTGDRFFVYLCLFSGISRLSGIAKRSITTSKYT